MNEAVYALLIAVGVSLAAGPALIRKLASLKVRQTISEDVPKRHLEKQGTPMMGGLIILLGAAVGIGAMWKGDVRVTGVVLLTLASALLGFLDDFLIATRGKSLGLKARHKLLVQFILAIAFVLWVRHFTAVPLGYVHILGAAGVDLGWVYYPLAVLMIVGMSNAFNLADGLDGLASGMTAILMLSLGLMTFEVGRSPMVFCWALAGGCIGFLWFNCNPAKVFMGDTGSLALGAAAAGIAIVDQHEVMLLLVGLVFIVEAVTVMIQVISFKSTGKRVFKMTPIHHHFELSGWPEQRIVVRFWIVQALLSLVTLALSGAMWRWGWG